MMRLSTLDAVRAQARGRFLDFHVEIFDDRLQRPDHERQPDEHERDRDAQRRERHLDAVSLQRGTQPPVRRVERRQRDTGDRGRQRERQIDQRIDDAPARKPVSRQHPGDDQPKHRVHHRRRERGADAELVRGDHSRIADGLQIAPQPCRGRPKAAASAAERGR